MDTGITAPSFASPSVVAEPADDGSLLLRSAEPLGDYPPDLHAGKITDKGYVNQRRVLATRAALAELLYPGPGRPTPPGVVVAERTT